MEALNVVSDAIAFGKAPISVLLPFHMKRTHADQLLVVTLLAKDWQVSCNCECACHDKEVPC